MGLHLAILLSFTRIATEQWNVFMPPCKGKSASPATLTPSRNATTVFTAALQCRRCCWRTKWAGLEKEVMHRFTRWHNWKLALKKKANREAPLAFWVGEFPVTWDCPAHYSRFRSLALPTKCHCDNNIPHTFPHVPSRDHCNKRSTISF